MADKPTKNTGYRARTRGGPYIEPRPGEPLALALNRLDEIGRLSLATRQVLADYPHASIEDTLRRFEQVLRVIELGVG